MAWLPQHALCLLRYVNWSQSERRTRAVFPAFAGLTSLRSTLLEPPIAPSCIFHPSITMVVDTVVAFDLYGTLLSTESIVKQLECHFGSDKAQSISTAWRRYQLEYTWRADSMREFPVHLLVARLIASQSCGGHSQKSPKTPSGMPWKRMASS